MANISNLAITGSSSSVTDITDLWYLRYGQLTPVQSAWSVKNGQLVNVFERRGVPVTMSFISPTPAAGTTISAGSTVTWSVQVPTVDGLVPTGSITFVGPGNTTKIVPLDIAGKATTTFVHGPSQTTVTANYTSQNGYSAPSISRSIVIPNVNTNFYFTGPFYDQMFYVNGSINITWTIRIDSQYGVMPQGTVAWDGPQGRKYSNFDSNGYASVTYTHTYGQRTVTATPTITNGFNPISSTGTGSATWRVRILQNVKFNQYQYLGFESGKNYAGANGAATNITSTIASGTLNGVNYRAFTRQNVPVKPNPNAYAVEALTVLAVFSNVLYVWLGWHTYTTLPSTGSYTGVNQATTAIWNLVPNAFNVVDMTYPLVNSLNNLSFRGLVFGGPDGTVYSWVQANCTIRVNWEWYEWRDT